MDNFSIMSLNVHNFCNSDMEDSLQDVMSLILKYDIIALQEVYNKEKLREIVKGYNYSYNRGLLLMTKHRIELLKNKSNDKFISLFVLLNGIRIFVTNVHLNYIDEKIRNEEIDDILDKINLTENRFGIEPEITAKISRIPNIRIYEVGITYFGRTYEEGKKIGIKDAFRAFYAIVKYSIFK